MTQLLNSHSKNLDTAHFVSPSFETLRQHVLSTLNTDIDLIIDHASLPSPLKEACIYAMTGNGKRVRPLLVASSYHTVQSELFTASLSKPPPSQPRSEPALSDAFNDGLNDECRRAMLAVELLHTYSLIHDDLPCMDDDELRRGRPTCHIKFGEATAMLTGDVLQTLAFEVLSTNIEGFAPISYQRAAQLIEAFSPRARRMVSGQMLDLNAENKSVPQIDLEAIHRDKTGALIEAAVLMGGICSDASDEQAAALVNFASNIGLAFQVQDDILDVTSSTDTLGKPTGSDEGLNKSTYVQLMGVEQATDYAKSLFYDATASITDSFGADNALNELADWLWARQK